MAFVRMASMIRRRLRGLSGKCNIKCLSFTTICACLCFLLLMDFGTGEAEFSKYALEVEETPQIWENISQTQRATWRDINPSPEDILTIGNIVIKSRRPKDYANLEPYLMRYDSESEVWIVYYLQLNSDGEPMIGGGMDVAIDANNLQVPLVWGEE